MIGGGITGAGILRDAALRGLRAALLEKGAFASGTSSRSSKLIHGGIRYLEHLQLGLVREACRERATLLRTAPTLVRPLPFLLPVYRGASRGRWKIQLGLWLYERLAGRDNLPPHRALQPPEVERLAPGLRRDSLRATFLYYDAQADDAALTRAVIDSAVRHGAVAAEEMEVLGFEKENGRIVAVRTRDRRTGEILQLRARVFLNASGPWTDATCRLDDPQASPKLRLTKGAHAVLEKSRLPVEAGVLLFAPQDGRVFFILPWKEKTLIGTTDTDFTGSPDEVLATPEDVDYLLRAASHYFPDLELKPSDVVGSFAGLRPLLHQEGGGASAVSREHQIFESASGLTTIAGGKLTTYRRMAEEAVDVVVRRLGEGGNAKIFGPCRTAEISI